MRSPLRRLARPMPCRALLGAIGLSAVICGLPARAQDAADPPDGASSERAQPSPRPAARPKPKRVRPIAPPPAQAGPDPSVPAAEPPEAAASPSPVQGMARTPPAPAAREAVIVCDPGQAVHFVGPKMASVWVTRSGTATVENPLRPLTPDRTRVLQLVIAERVATAYGADLDRLRRGASPAALEAALGGAIAWDARMTALPDRLNIVADSGASLAELSFEACGTAPAIRAPAPAQAQARRDRKPARAVARPAARDATPAANP